ncbi:MAG: alpha/beta hydrolase family protein [Parachlamydiaceae bacterium]
MQLAADVIDAGTALSVYHVGPSLDQGPLPALFYFALSGKDSLELDPYNQPVTFLKDSLIRIFSFTLPGHGPGLKNTAAIKQWAEAFQAGRNPIKEFIDTAKENIAFLIKHQFIAESKMAVAGLSRGGFMAAHLASEMPQIKLILGFAPLMRLDLSLEFKAFPKNPVVEQTSLIHLIPKLIDRTLCFHIGNRDTRVHTDECFKFIHKLAKVAQENRIRSPQVEMVIHPSIGHHGHGTAPKTFLEGANWLKEKMRML